MLKLKFWLRQALHWFLPRDSFSINEDSLIASYFLVQRTFSSHWFGLSNFWSLCVQRSMNEPRRTMNGNVISLQDFMWILLVLCVSSGLSNFLSLLTDLIKLKFTLAVKKRNIGCLIVFYVGEHENQTSLRLSNWARKVRGDKKTFVKP